MENLPEFEIHFASQINGASEDLKKELYSMGFRDDGLIGQAAIFDEKTNRHYSSCPLIDIHITWDTYNKKEYLEKKKQFINLLDKYKNNCTGYTHAEIVKPEWDLDINFKQFDESIPLPFKHFESSPTTKFKKWDIHISAFKDSLHPELENILFNKMGMYFIDVLKKNIRIDRVFTIQGTNHVREGLDLFDRLHKYILQVGGMEGAIKFEQTIYGDILGEPGIVPPAIEFY